LSFLDIQFWILIADYIKINDTFGFFDSSSKSSEIELGLGPSQIMIFHIVFHHFLRILPIAVRFRVDVLIYFGSSNQVGAKKQNGGFNQNVRQT
jgi:hypothetical protein